MGGGGYLLLVLNPPWTPEHKEAILQRVAKGLLSWDVKATGTDLASAEKACLSVKVSAGPHNELLIQHSTESLALEVLLNPEVSTLRQCFKNMMVSGTTHKHVIHAGYAFSGTGDWILQDGVFSSRDVEALLHDTEVEEVLRRQKFHTLHVHCSPEGSWSSQPPTGVSLNPPDIADSLAGSAHLLGCLDAVLTSPPLTSLLPSSSVVGNIRFRRPTMYVFPGGQGDCALFGVTGFTLLVDGGFARKPCFWEFVRHLDRLDSLLVTRFNQFNSCGLTALAQRKALERVYPQVGHVFCNAVRSPSDEELQKDRDQLLVSVVAQGLEFLQGVREMGLSPQACQRDAHPLTLFHKVGQGTLEMFVLSPGRVTEEDTSVCVLLVWRPAKASEPVTRILLPGSAPQSVIFDGLSKLSHLAVLRSRTVTAEERLGLKRSKVQDKPLRATSVPPRPRVAKRAAAKGESPSPSPTPPLPEKTKPKVHTNRSVESLPKKQDEVKRPPAKPTKREPKKPTADKTEAKEEKVAKITAKVSAKVAETAADKEKLVEKLGENEVDNVEEKDISKIISDKALKKLPVEIEKIDAKAQEEIVAKVEEKVSVKRELKKATPTRPPAKSKGAKDVTNKMAVEGKTAARKAPEPAKAKSRPVVAPPTRPMVRDSRSKSPSSSASSSPKRAPPKAASERPVRSVRGGVRTAKPTPTEPAKVTEGEKLVVTEKPTAQVKPDKRIEIVTQSGDESSGSKEAVEEKAATEATKEEKPFIEPSSSDESKKDVEKQKPAAIVDEVPIKAVILGTAYAAAPDEEGQKPPTRPFEKEIADAEMWPTAGDAKEMAEPPGHAMSPEPTITASSEGVPSLVDEVIDLSLQADSSAARPTTEQPDLSQVRALSSGQRTPDSLDTPREVGDGTAPSSRDEILDAMEKHHLVSREQVLEIKRRDSVDSIEGEIAAEEEEVPHEAEEAEQKETEKLPQPSVTDKTIGEVMPETQQFPTEVAPSDTAPKPAETTEADLLEEPKPDVPVCADSIEPSVAHPLHALATTLDETKSSGLDEQIPQPPVPSEAKKSEPAAATVPEGAEEIEARQVEEKEKIPPLVEAPAVGEIKLDDIQEKSPTEHAVLPSLHKPEEEAGTAPEIQGKVLTKDLKESPQAELQLPVDDKHISVEMQEREVEMIPPAEHGVSPKLEEPDGLLSARIEEAGIATADSEPLKAETQLQKPEEPTSAVDERQADEIEPAELKPPAQESLSPRQPELAVPFTPEIPTAKTVDSAEVPKETAQLEKLEPHDLELSPTAREREPSKAEPDEVKAVEEEPSLQAQKGAEVSLSTEIEVEKAPLVAESVDKAAAEPEDLKEKEPPVEKPGKHLEEEKEAPVVLAERTEPDLAVPFTPEIPSTKTVDSEEVLKETPQLEKLEPHDLELSPTAREREPSKAEPDEVKAVEEEPSLQAQKGAEVSLSAEMEAEKAPLVDESVDKAAAEPEDLKEKEPPVEKPGKHLEEEKEAPVVLAERTEPELAVPFTPEIPSAKSVDSEEVLKETPQLEKLEPHDLELSPTAREHEPSKAEPDEVKAVEEGPSLQAQKGAEVSLSAEIEVVEKAPLVDESVAKASAEPEDLKEKEPPVEKPGKHLEEEKEAPVVLAERTEPETPASPVKPDEKLIVKPDDSQEQKLRSEEVEDHGPVVPLVTDLSKPVEIKPSEIPAETRAEPASLPMHEAPEAAEKADTKPEDLDLKKLEDQGTDSVLPAVTDYAPSETERKEPETSKAEPTALVEREEAAPELSPVSEAVANLPSEPDYPKKQEPESEMDSLTSDLPRLPADEHKASEPKPIEETEARTESAVASDQEELELAKSPVTASVTDATAEPSDVKMQEPQIKGPDDRDHDLPASDVDEHEPRVLTPADVQKPAAAKPILLEQKQLEAAVPATEDVKKQDVGPDDAKDSEERLKEPEDDHLHVPAHESYERKAEELMPGDREMTAEPTLPTRHSEPEQHLSHVPRTDDKAPVKLDDAKEKPCMEKADDYGHDVPSPSVDEQKVEKIEPAEKESVVEPEHKEPEAAVSATTEPEGETVGMPQEFKEKEQHSEKPEDYDADLLPPAVVEPELSEVKPIESDVAKGKQELLPKHEPKPAISPMAEVADEMAPEKDVIRPEMQHDKEDHVLEELSVDEHKAEKLLPTKTPPDEELGAAPEFKEVKPTLSPLSDDAGKPDDKPGDLKEKEPQFEKPQDYVAVLEPHAAIEHKPSEEETTDVQDLGKEPTAFPEHEELKPAISPISKVSEKIAPGKEDVTKKEPDLEKKEGYSGDLPEVSAVEYKPEKLLPSESEPKAEPSPAPELGEPETAISPIPEVMGETAGKTEDLEEREPHKAKAEERAVDLESPVTDEHKLSEITTEPEKTTEEPVSLPEYEEPKSLVSSARDAVDKAAPEKKDVTKEPHVEKKDDDGRELPLPYLDEHEQEKIKLADIKHHDEPGDLKAKEKHYEKREDFATDLESPLIGEPKPSEIKAREPEEMLPKSPSLGHKDPGSVENPIADISDKTVPEEKEIAEEPCLEKKDHGLELSEPAIDKHIPEKLLPTKIEPEVEPAGTHELEEHRATVSTVTDASRETAPEPEDLKEGELHWKEPEERGVGPELSAVAELKSGEVITEPEKMATEPAPLTAYEKPKPVVSSAEEAADKVVPEEKDTQEEPYMEKKEDDGLGLSSPTVDDHGPTKVQLPEAEPKAEPSLVPGHEDLEAVASPMAEAARKAAAESEGLKKEPQEKREDAITDLESFSVGEQDLSEMNAAERDKVKVELAFSTEHEEPKPDLSPITDVSGKIAPETKDVKQEEPHLEVGEDHSLSLVKPSIDKLMPEKSLPAEIEPEGERTGAGELEEREAAVSAVTEAQVKGTAEPEDLKEEEPHWDWEEPEAPAALSKYEAAESPASPVPKYSGSEDLTKEELGLAEKEHRDIPSPPGSEHVAADTEQSEPEPKAESAAEPVLKDTKTVVSAVPEPPGEKGVQSEDLHKKEPHLGRPEDSDIDSVSPARSEYNESEMIEREPEKVKTESAALPEHEDVKPYLSPTADIADKAAPKTDLPEQEQHFKKKEVDGHDVLPPAADDHKKGEVKSTEIEKAIEPGSLPAQEKPRAAMGSPLEAGEVAPVESEQLKEQVLYMEKPKDDSVFEPKGGKEEPHFGEPDEHDRDVLSPAAAEPETDKIKSTEPKYLEAESTASPPREKSDATVSPLREVPAKTSPEPEHLKSEEPHLQEATLQDRSLVSPGTDIRKRDELNLTEIKKPEGEHAVLEHEKLEATAVIPTEVTEKTGAEPEDLKTQRPELVKAEEHGQSPAVDSHKHDDLKAAELEETTEKASPSPEPKKPETTLSTLHEVADKTAAELEELKKVEWHSEQPDHGRDILSSGADEKLADEKSTEPEAKFSVSPDQKGFEDAESLLLSVTDKVAPQSADLQSQVPKRKDTEVLVHDLLTPGVDDHKPVELKLVKSDDSITDSSVLPEHKKPQAAVSPTPEVDEETPSLHEDLTKHELYPKERDDRLHDLPLSGLEHKAGELKSVEIVEGGEKVALPADQAQVESPQSFEPKVDEKLASKSEETKEQEPHLKEPEDQDRSLPSPAADEHKQAQVKSTEAEPTVLAKQEEHEVPVSPVVKGTDSTVSEPEDIQKQEPEAHDIEPVVSSLPEVAQKSVPGLEGSKQQPLSENEDQAVVPEHEVSEAAVSPASELAKEAAAHPGDLQKEEPHLEKPGDYDHDLSLPDVGEHKTGEFKPDELGALKMEQTVVTEKAPEPAAPLSVVPKVAEGPITQYEDDKQHEPHVVKPDYAPAIPSTTFEEHEPAELKPAGHEELRVEPDQLPEHVQTEVATKLASKDSDIAATEHDKSKKQEPRLGKPDDQDLGVESASAEKHKPDELIRDVAEEAGAEPAELHDHKDSSDGVSAIPQATEKPDAFHELPSPAVSELKPIEVKSAELEKPAAQPSELHKKEHLDVAPSPMPDVSEEPSLEPADLGEEKQHLEKAEHPKSIVDDHKLDKMKPDEIEQPTVGLVSEHKSPDTAVFPASEDAKKETVTPEGIKTPESYLETLIDQGDESPLRTVEEQKPEGTGPIDTHRLEAEPVSFLPEKTGITSSPLSEVADKTPVTPDYDRGQELHLEEHDHVRSLASPAAHEHKPEELKPLERKELETSPISSEHQERETAEVPTQVTQAKSPAPDHLKTQEPDFEKPEDHVYGERKPEEFEIAEVQESEAAPAILRSHKEPEDAAPATDVVGETPVGLEELKDGEPHMKKTGDLRPDIPSPGFEDQISEFKATGPDETKKEPVSAEHKGAEAALHSVPKPSEETAALTEDVKDQERHLEKPEEPAHGITLTADQRMPDHLVLAKTEEQMPELGVYPGHKEPESALCAMPKDTDKEAAITEDLKEQKPHLLEQKDHASELPSSLDAGKPSDLKPALLEEQGIEPKVACDLKEPELSASSTSEIAEKSSASPEDLKKHESQWEEPRDRSHVLEKPEPREFPPADLEEQSTAPATLPDYKDDQVHGSAVPVVVDKSSDSQDLKMSEPSLEKTEGRDHSPVVHIHEDKMKASKPDEPTKTAAVFPDDETHEAALVVVSEVAEKSVAAPESAKSQPAYKAEPEDPCRSVSSPDVDKQKPEKSETTEFRKPCADSVLFEEKESTEASSKVPEVADSKAPAGDDAERQPQSLEPEQSGRDSPSAVDVREATEPKLAELKGARVEPAVLTESKKPEAAKVEVPDAVDKMVSVPDEAKEQQLRSEKAEDHALDLPSAPDGHKLDELKRDEFEPATLPDRHESEALLPHDVKPDTDTDREPGAEPSRELPERSSFEAEGIVTSPIEEMIEETAGSVRDGHEAHKSITEVQEIEYYEPQVEESDLQGLVTSPLHSVTEDAQRLIADSEDEEQCEGICITELPNGQEKEHIYKTGQELAPDVLKDSDEAHLRDTTGKPPSGPDESPETSLKPDVTSYVPEDYDTVAATTLIPEVDGTIAEDLIAAKEKAQHLRDIATDGAPSVASPVSLTESTLGISTKNGTSQIWEELPDVSEQKKDFCGTEKLSVVTDDSSDPSKQMAQQIFQAPSGETLLLEEQQCSAEPAIDQGIQLPSDVRERIGSSEDILGARKAEPGEATTLPHDEVCFGEKQEVMKVLEALPKSSEKKDLPSSEVREEAESLMQQSADSLPETKPDISDKEPFSSTCPPTTMSTGPQVAELVSHEALKGEEAEPMLSPTDLECTKQDAPSSAATVPVEPPRTDREKMSAAEDAKLSGDIEPSFPFSETKSHPTADRTPDTTRTDQATPLRVHGELSILDNEPGETPAGRSGDVCEPSEVPHKEMPQEKSATAEQAEPPQPTDSARIVGEPLYSRAKPYDTKPQIASRADRDTPKRDDVLHDTHGENITQTDTTPLDVSQEHRKETELQPGTVKEAAQTSVVKGKIGVEGFFPLQSDIQAQQVPDDACLTSTDASTPKDSGESTVPTPKTKGDEGRAPSSAEDLERDFCKEEGTLPNILTQAMPTITVEREVIKQDMRLPLETAAPGGGVYSKARELLGECVSGDDATSPGGAMSTESPKSSVSDESVPSVVPKDEVKEVSAKEKEHDDKTCDDDLVSCSGVTTGYDFRSPSEVLKRDFLQETSNTIGKEVDKSMVMSPSQDEEGRRLLEIVKSQLICEDFSDLEVTTGKEDLPRTKDIPPADSTKDMIDGRIADSRIAETKLHSELIEKDDEVLSRIIDQITEEKSYDVTSAAPQKLHVLEGATEKPFSLARDDIVEPSTHYDIPVNYQDQRKLSSHEQLLSEGAPQDEESACTSRPSGFEKARGDLRDEARLDRPAEVFQDAQESLVHGGKPVDQVSSKTAEAKSSEQGIQDSQAPIVTESFKAVEEGGQRSPLDIDATSSSPVALTESAELSEMTLVSGKDKQSGSICEDLSCDPEIALTKGVIFDARLSSGSEGTKARGEARSVEGASDLPTLTHQRQDHYQPETPWADHTTSRRDSQEVSSLEIQDQPMKDPRATCPTALDTPELAHMQQRLSVEYESSITSVSEIEFMVDAKTSGAPPSDSSSRDDAKAADVSKDETDASRASSPESPPQSPVKRLAAEHPRASKRSRTASESKHPISTQGSSEADISSEDEDSTRKGLFQHHTLASADGVDSQKERVATQKSPQLQKLEGMQLLGDTSSDPSKASLPQALRPSLEAEPTSSSDDTSGATSGTTSKDSEIMREYSKHLESSPGSRFSLDSTCSVTSEERSYTELEKPYQRGYSQESFSSTTREYPQDSSRSGSLYSDSTLEPLSAVDQFEAGRPEGRSDNAELSAEVDNLASHQTTAHDEICARETEFDASATITGQTKSTGPVSDTSPTTEGRQPAAKIPHSHGIASGLFAALKTELCVIDSPSMDTVLDQTGKDAQPIPDQTTGITSAKVAEAYEEPSAHRKQPGREQEALPGHGHIDSERDTEPVPEDLSEPTEQKKDKESGKAHPVPPLTPEQTKPATGSETAFSGDIEPLFARKISGEITPSKTIRFQLPEETMKEPPTDQSAKEPIPSHVSLDGEGQSKELFERAVRLEQLNEAEFLESMATDEEDDLSRASLKPSTSSTTSSSRHEDSHKPAERDDDVTDDDVTLASALSSGLPTELVCMAQSSADISKDISRIAKCADSLELVTSPPRSPQDAGTHDEPAAVAAGLASGLPVELVCMVESKELCSEIKRAEEQALHHVIEKKADYVEDDNGVAMQTYIERRLSESDYCTDKQALASPTYKEEPMSKAAEATSEQKPGKEFDDLHLNGTSHSPPSVGLVAGLAAGLATELVCMPQSAEELCIEAAESSRSARGSQGDVIPPEMTSSIYETLSEHLDETLSSSTDGVRYSGLGGPESTGQPRMGQIPVQREVITTVTSRRVVYKNDGPPDTWTTSTLSDAPQHDAEDDSKRTTVTYVYRTYTSGEGDDKEGPVLSSDNVPSRFDEEGLPFDMLLSNVALHAREEGGTLEGDQGTGSTTRRYVYTVSSDQGTPEMFIRQSDDSDSASHPDSSIHSVAMDEVARITDMAAAAVSQSPNGWTVVHRSADSSSQRPLELTRPTELLDRRNGHVTHVTETRQIVYHPSSSGDLRFPLGRSADETCLPPEGSDPKTILEFMAAQTKQAAKEMLEEQPLYEEDEEAALEQSSLSDASPLVEEPVFAKTLQPDYPELVELSAGNTPSEPPSPHSAIHDARARHNGEPGVTSVQRMVVVEETEPPSTPGRSQARRVVSYVEEPTTVVREEWVLEGGHGEAPQVISQSSMFHHEILTVEGSTSTTPSHMSGGDPVRFTHHFERDIGAADDALQQSSLKTSAVVHEQQEWSRSAADSTGPTTAAAATSSRPDAVRELQAVVEGQSNGRRDGETAPFDIRDWGKPLGLPVPPDPSSKSSSKTGRKTAPRNSTDVVYVDLTYVPHHGDPGYCDAEFFSRVRARYYVLSGTNPSQQVLDALLEAKRGWGEPDAPVTVIPTYETDALCYWIAHNQKALEEHHIDVAPSASRCTINLQDHESSCAAYRLEF